MKVHLLKITTKFNAREERNSHNTEMLCISSELQRETLLSQLKTNQEDMLSTVAELDVHEESEEQNYDV